MLSVPVFRQVERRIRLRDVGEAEGGRARVRGFTRGIGAELFVVPAAAAVVVVVLGITRRVGAPAVVRGAHERLDVPGHPPARGARVGVRTSLIRGEHVAAHLEGPQLVRGVAEHQHVRAALVGGHAPGARRHRWAPGVVVGGGLAHPSGGLDPARRRAEQDDERRGGERRTRERDGANADADAGGPDVPEQGGRVRRARHGCCDERACGNIQVVRSEIRHRTIHRLEHHTKWKCKKHIPGTLCRQSSQRRHDVDDARISRHPMRPRDSKSGRIAGSAEDLTSGRPI